MTAEQDGLDLAAVLAEHEGHAERCGAHRHTRSLHCLPYRLAAFALDLQGKVARVEAPHREHYCEACATDFAPCKTHAALADPTPTATCPKVSPLPALTDLHCTRPEGHAGGCVFVGRDGRTPLEVMPK